MQSLLLHTTNRKSYNYGLSNRGNSDDLIESTFKVHCEPSKYDFSYSCAAVDKISIARRAVRLR